MEKTRLPAKSQLGTGQRSTKQISTMRNTRGKSISQRTRITFPSSNSNNNLHTATTFATPLSLSHPSNIQSSVQPISIIIEHQLLVICGAGSQDHDYRSQQPQIKYRSYIPAGEQRWRPSIEILDESVAGPEETSLTWADLLRFRVLEDTTPFDNWRQLYNSQGHGKRPLMRDCYVTSDWDNHSKQPIWLPRSAKDPGTPRNLLNTWFPNSRDRITIIFEYIPSHQPKVTSSIQSNPNNSITNDGNSIEHDTYFESDEDYSASKTISSDRLNIRRSHSLSQLPSSPPLLLSALGSIHSTRKTGVADTTSGNQPPNASSTRTANIELLLASSSSLISVGELISTTLNLPTNVMSLAVKPRTPSRVLAMELSESSLSSPPIISSSPELPNTPAQYESKFPFSANGPTLDSPIDGMFIILFLELSTSSFNILVELHFSFLLISPSIPNYFLYLT